VSLKNYNLLFISIIIVLSKWLSSTYFFDEPLGTKIIFESVPDGEAYYPQIKYLSKFLMNYSYDPEISNLRNIAIPISGILVHSILLKIFGFYSFIIAEWICVFIFLLIFYQIFNLFFSKNLSTIFSILIFCSPFLISETFLSNFQYLKVFEDNFYNLRVPRPMISNLFFFGFILIILKIDQKNIYKYSNFILIGLILGLTLSSVYYYFLTQVIFLIIFFHFNLKNNLFFELKDKLKFYLTSIFVFFISILPFLINLYFHEDEFTSRQGVFNLDYEKKIILLKYIAEKYLSTKFLAVIFTISLISYFVNFFRLREKKLNNVFYLVFLSSLISPVLFVIFSNKSFVFYHFINFIVVNGVLYLIVFSLIIFNNILKIRINNFITYVFLILISCLYVINDVNKFKNLYTDIEYKNQRNEFSKINSQILGKFNLNKSSLLSFETNIIIWSIMNDIKYLDFINGFFTSKKDYMIEEDIYSAFKKLELEEENFYRFIRNNKSSWRYLNKNITKYVYYKYQANSLVTFNNSKDFKKNELIDINKSSPLLHQQSIIPQYEINRLIFEFNKFDKKLTYPDIIVLNKMDDFMNFSKLKLFNYCKVFDGDFYLMYFNKTVHAC
tara:strand:- start:275 stop:2110 length:1836 start_codon:yes stop_codon:yes gene_type:complete